MSYLKITTESAETFSQISNHFIDYYMTQAPGEFVKIYLYLVRLLQARTPVSLSDITDHFNITKNDLCRAIKYWMSHGVLRLERNELNQTTGITLLTLEAPVSQSLEDELGLGDLSISAIPNVASTKEKITDATTERTTPDKKPFSPAALEKAKSDDDLETLIFLAETYFKKPLSAKSLESLIYIYDQLGFSAEVVQHLLEYCVVLDKKSMSYAEAVAKNWYKKGVFTLEEIKKISFSMNPIYMTVLHAMDIDRKQPTEKQTEFIECWTNEWGFAENIIVRACKIGVEKLSDNSQIKNRFSFVNGILRKWHEQGVTKLSDIDKLEAEHQEQKQTMKAVRSQNANQRSPKPNSFTSFTQKDMSSEIDELEHLWLNNSNNG